MSLKKHLLVSTTILALTAGSAFASETSDAIVAALTAENYTVTEVRVSLFRIKVEAYIDGVKTERTYTKDGVLIKEETTIGGVETEIHYDADGNVVKVETDDEDDGDDDDDDDDEDDDDDDEDDDDDDDDDDDEDD